MTDDRSPIAPHGGSLVDLLVPGADAEALSDEAGNLPLLTIGERELSDLEMLATGALSPLTGFQSEDDYHSILETMHLTDGLAWAIPVVLGVADDDLHRIGGGLFTPLLPR
jgi:sulfate adenylyltransferase